MGRTAISALAAHVKLMSRLVLLFAVPLAGLFLVGGRAMLALHGPEFVRGARTVALLTMGHLVNASLGLTGWVLLAAGRSKTVLVNNVGALAVNIALCLVLIPRFGMEGAAASATLAIFVLQIVHAIQAAVIAGAHPLSVGFARLAVLGALVIGAELGVDRMLGGNALARGDRRGGRWRRGVPLAGLAACASRERDVLRAILRLKPKAGRAT